MENRSMKRRQRKLNKVKIVSEENDEIMRFVKVLGIVVVCFVAIYFFTRAFVTKDLFNKDSKENETVETPSINYSVISLGSLFTRPYKDYYVLVYNSENTRAGYYGILVENYRASEDAIKLYTADLNSPFNDSFYTKDESNFNATKIDGLKVKDLTLIKISNGKIVKFFEEEETIVTELKPK